MIYRIENKKDLRKALRESRDGDTVLGHEEIIKLDHKTINVNKRLYLEDCVFDCSAGGETLPDTDPSILIRRGVEFRGCNFLDFSEHRLSNFIKVDGAKFLVMHDCFIKGGTLSAIWLNKCAYTRINQCDFNLPEKPYYNYGVWQGGALSAKNNILSLTETSFAGGRHSVGSSYHLNHINISRCEFSHSVKHVLDRHSGTYNDSGDFGWGGGNFTVKDCVFNDDNRYALSVPIPLDGYKVTVEGNTFRRPAGKALEFELNIGGEKVKLNEDRINHPQINIGANTYV